MGDYTPTAPHIKAILTGVVYITTGSEELDQVVNEFPRSEKKVKRLLSHYTSKYHYKVGEFFTLPPQYTDKVIVNRGHFAFRRAGPGRQFLKFTWIKPSKPYVKGIHRELQNANNN